MARIPDEEVARLKAEVSLERLVEARGVELRRHGADLIGLCPFHDDREPSLVVSPAKNLWHCLGACGTGGSVIDWVMRVEGVSFRHAVELLRDGGVDVGGGSAPVRSTVRRLDSPLDVGAADAELLSQVVAFYHATLKQTPDALGYLNHRGIAHAEALDRFQLGFADRTLGYRLPNKQRKEGAEVRGRLQALGVLRGSGHEHFRGSLVIPVRSLEGVVTEIYGRKLKDDPRTGTPAHLYLPGPHRGVWNTEALVASKEIILCESLIDALTFWCVGFRNVTASYGTEGFTADHFEALRAHGTERVLIAYDHDAAGDRAADALAERLMAEGVECFRVVFPLGADANEFASGADSPTEALGRVIRAATWMGAGDKKPAAKRENDDPGTVAADSSLAAEPLPASPVPSLPPGGAQPELVGDELRIRLGDRRWRVRGLSRQTSFDLLRLNVLVARDDVRDGQVFHVDTLDLYSARARAVFVKGAAEELGVGEEIIRHDLGRVLLAAEERAEEAIRAAQAPAPEAAVVLTPAEEAAALELLRDPKLVERITADFERAGMVGEATNALVGYLAAVSRKLAAPLAVIVQSTSAAGKSALMDAVLSMLPDEDVVKFSAMTGQSLFYMGEADLAHRVLAIVEEEGASRAAYALKLLQSERELSIASTGKDNATGRLVTHTYRVAGPVAIVLTTTAIDIDEELLNRCVVLTIDEDRAQTRAIHDRQRARETLEGLLADAERARLLKVHRDAQRLLRPVLVANPYAPRLTFADERTRTRRDHTKYLTLIRAIALLHQHQRPLKTVTHAGERVDFIEATLADIALANRLAHEVLGCSLDELAPQTRRLLDHLEAFVTARCEANGVCRGDFRFTRRELREHCGWSDFQIRTHLERLVDLEYVVVHRGGRGQSFVYELCWDGGGVDGRPHLSGLIDTSALTGDDPAHAYDGNFEGRNGHIEPPSRAHRAHIEGGSISPRNGRRPGVSASPGAKVAPDAVPAGANGAGHNHSGASQ